MKIIDVLIVDDEPLAQEVLETYVQKIPYLNLVGKCDNALEAFGVINKQHVDLMLMDINMPELNGIDFLRSIKKPPKVIFTTAYSEYAVESYELEAVDYLLKPIEFERFIIAVNRVKDQLEETESTTGIQVATETNNDILFVKSDGKLIKITISQLWLIESLKDYLMLYTDTRKVMVHSTMKSFEEQLAHVPYLVRVNKSYIINLNYITEIEGNAIKLKDKEVIIGKTYRDDVFKMFEKYKLL